VAFFLYRTDVLPNSVESLGLRQCGLSHVTLFYMKKDNSIHRNLAELVASMSSPEV
jgi:hypothetical protein